MTASQRSTTGVPVQEGGSLPSTAAPDAQQGGDEHEAAIEPVPVPEFPEPSAIEMAKHCLTHLPYRRWCRWCVMARRRGRFHRRLPPCSRSIPLLVLDDCFVEHAGDDRWLTVLVGRLYPSRAMFAAPCNQNGPDAHVTARLASFLRACGVSQLSYMCDQEGAVRTMLNEALEISKGRGEYVGAVPENSPIGERASNRRAEQ